MDDNRRSFRVHVLVGRTLLKGDFFRFELDKLGVADRLALLVGVVFFGSIIFG